MLLENLQRARMLMATQQYAEAIAIYQQIIIQSPGSGTYYLEMSSCLIGLGQLDEALVVLKQGSNILETDSVKHIQLQLAKIYLLQKRFQLAAPLFEGLLKDHDLKIEAIIGLSNLHIQNACPSKAIELLSHIPPDGKSDSRYLINLSLAHFQMSECDTALEILLQKIAATDSSEYLISNAMMFLSYSNSYHEYRRRLIELINKDWSSRLKILSPTARHLRLRVGFVSADFQLHPVGYFLSSFIRELSQYVDIYLYSNSSTEDSLTTDLKKNVIQFDSIVDLATNHAVSLIQSHEIDILIDLSGHTAGNRLDIFKERAAPYQLSYLGYPESTFIPNMDGLISDKVHIRPDEHEQYSEHVWYLPSSRFCFKPHWELPNLTAPPVIQNHYITFGNYGNPVKISSECGEIWGNILLAVPGSRLKLKHALWNDIEIREKFLTRWLAMGIQPGRIEFHGGSPYDSYIREYGDIDLVLDSYPFTGGTTSFEALWMGVPILTRQADSPASRQTASILKAIGETRYLLSSTNEAIELINQLLENPQTLSLFKQNIRQKLRSTSVGEPTIFAKQFFEILCRIQGQIVQIH